MEMGRCSLKFCLTALLCFGTAVCLCLMLSSSSMQRYIVETVALTGGAPQTSADAPSEASSSSSRIPRLLHLTVQSELVLSDYRPAMSSCARHNPDWTAYLWTNEDLELLLRRRQPELLDLYRQLGSQTERQEFAKYPILYHMGGVALESDVECLKPLTGALEGPATANAFLSEERPENVMVYENRLFKLSPAAMGSEAGHDFFGYIIDILLGKVPTENLSLDKNFLTVCHRQWLEEERNRTPVAVLPSDRFSPNLRDPQTMRLLCGYHGDAKLSGVYGARERGCAMMKAAAEAGSSNVTESTIGVHHHMQLERLTRLHRLLHPAGVAEFNSSSAGGDGRFNATELLMARRFSHSLRIDQH